MHDVFLSYARGDDPAYVADLHRALAAAGLTVWWDRESMPSRALTFHYEIRTAIDESTRVLLVLGPDAAASDYVKSEWQYALARGKAVTAVIRRGGTALLPPELKNLHAVNGEHDESRAATFAELVRLLREPVPALAPTIDVPDLPPHFLPRADDIARLAGVLLIDRERPDQVAAGPRCLVLHGMSGSGKSVLAAAFAAMVRTRRAFPDGVIWIACGPGVDGAAAMRRIHVALRPGVPAPDAARELAASLNATLAERSVLIVLDDVRAADDAAPFVSALGVGCRTLVTALDGSMATTLGTAEQRVEVLTAERSMALLRDWVTSTSLPPAAAAVVEESGGLPFALAVIGAMAADGHGWDEILALLRERDLDLVQRKFPGYAHPHLFRALDAGVEALRQAEPLAAELYLDLAVFRGGVAWPEGALLRFWRRRPGLSENRARLTFPILERRSLIAVEQTASGRRIRLHNLHEDYLRVVAATVVDLHAQLLDAYNPPPHTPWAAGPDDGYYFENLAFHLQQAQRIGALYALVDRPWIEKQLERSASHRATLVDLTLARDVATQPPVDLAALARVCLLESIVRTAAVAANVADESMIGVLAVTRRFDVALAWAALQPKDRRLEAYLLIGRSLVEANELKRARALLAEAVALIAQLGELIHTGFIPDLAQLNAVHALVGFPEPEQWEGTTDDMVALARIPLDAAMKLIPVLASARCLDVLNGVRHPFWGLYDCLIPRVAAEWLATSGRAILAREVLGVLQFPNVTARGLDDVDNAAAYREAVAWSALGELDRAVAMVEAIPNPQYRAVGYHRIAVHAAAAGQSELAMRLWAGIANQTEKELALGSIADAFVASPDLAALSVLSAALAAAGDHDRQMRVRAAGGELDAALAEADTADDDFERARRRMVIADAALRSGQLATAAAIADVIVVEVAQGAGAGWVMAPFIDPRTPDIQRALTLRLVALLISTDRWNACIESLDTIPVPAKWTVAIRLAEILGKRGRLQWAMAMAEGIEDLPPRVLVLANAVMNMNVAETDGAGARAAVATLLDAHERLTPDQAARVPLDRFLPVIMHAGLHEEALRIMKRLGRTEPRTGVHVQIALQRASAGEPEMAQLIAASYRPELAAVAGRAALAQSFCHAARAWHEIGDAAQAAHAMERCAALLDGTAAAGSPGQVASDRATLAAQLERVRALTALGQHDTAADLAWKLGGLDPVERLLVLAKPGGEQAMDQVQIPSQDAARIVAFAGTQATALLHVATALTKSGRPEAAPLIERVQLLASLEVQLGAEDQGRADFAEALALAAPTERVRPVLGDRPAASRQAARAMVAAGHVADAFLAIDMAVDQLRSNPFGAVTAKQQVITADEFWTATRDREATITELLATAIELAIAADSEPYARLYADIAVRETLHAPVNDHVRVVCLVAPFESRHGNAARAKELLAHAEERVAQSLEYDDWPRWHLDIARAYAHSGAADRAEEIWRRELLAARGGHPAGVVAAVDTGMACLARAGRARELGEIVTMLEDVERMALLS